MGGAVGKVFFALNLDVALLSQTHGCVFCPRREKGVWMVSDGNKFAFLLLLFANKSRLILEEPSILLSLLPRSSPSCVSQERSDAK